MRVNSNINIYGEKVILVPYRILHVERYHTWMQSTDLQQLTASEPLSIEEEYQMQKTWLEDEDKCTFIILDKSKFAESEDEITSMVGDTNLFFVESEDSLRIAEAEIMIAEDEARGKKFGLEAMLLMLRYGYEQLNVEKYQVKIALSNVKSIALFTKIGFTETSRSEVFQETTMNRVVTEGWKQWVREQTKRSKMTTVSYEDPQEQDE